MEKQCSNCVRWTPDKFDGEEAPCSLLRINTRPAGCCPGCMLPDMTSEEYAEQQREARELRNTLLPNNQPAIKIKKASSKSAVAKPVLEREEELTVKLFEHQIKAREFFKDKNEIALFFEMGCGKTLTSMMIVCDKFKAGLIDSLLVIAPNDVHKQWFDDLCNDESVLSKAIKQENVECTGQIVGGRGGQKQLYEFDENDGLLHIVCTNVDTFSTPHKWEPIVEWATNNKTAIIIDEATVIKNPNSKRAQRILYEFNNVVTRGKTILCSIKINPVRIVLTGTPVTNGPIDLWAIMEFVRPNFFGKNYYAFTNYYGMFTKLAVADRVVNVPLTENMWKSIRNCSSFIEAYTLFGCSEDTYMTITHQDKYLGPYKHADEIKKMLEPNAIFAKLVDCVDMPKVNYIVKNVTLSIAQEACYNSMKKDLLAKFVDEDGDIVSATAKNKLVAMVRLQQIASGFVMAHEVSDEFEVYEDESYDIKPDEVTWIGDSNPKLEQLMRDVDELDKPILIMTRFSAEASKIYDLMKDKYSTCLITGWKTVGSIEAFKNGEYDIMVANIAKIARGFNLQNAHTTIYFSNTFSMELRQQSEFRTFRMGQKHPCTYVDYVACDIDKTVINALSMKKNMLEFIRNKDVNEVL